MSDLRAELQKSLTSNASEAFGSEADGSSQNKKVIRLPLPQERSQITAQLEPLSGRKPLPQWQASPQ